MRRLLTTAIAAVALLSCACQSLPTTDHEAAVQSMNPWAAAQPTEQGRTISTVEVIGLDVYVGFGDANVNSGPIAVTSWSILDETWTHHFDAATEWIIEYAEVDGQVWVPYADPTIYADYAVGLPWVEGRAGPGSREAFYHVWDLLEHDGEVYAIGTKRKTAQPMVKRFDGETWHEDLVLPNPGDLIFAVSVGGELRIQTRSQGDWARQPDGSWVPAPKVIGSDYARDPMAFGERVLAMGWATSPRLWDSAGEFGVAFLDARDLAEGDDGCAYALRVGSIDRLCGENDEWVTVTETVPEGASALDVAHGFAWVGTTGSELVAVNLPPA